MLDIPLSLLRSEDFIMTLRINEAVQPILSREAGDDTGSMLPDTPC